MHCIDTPIDFLKGNVETSNNVIKARNHMKALSTAKINGYFDFTSNLICLSKYNRTHVKDLTEWAKGFDAGKNWLYSLEARSLITHESTHFLDITTTNWGLEYIHRKLLVLAPRNSYTPEQAAAVYMLNTLEIEIHNDLVIPSTAICDFDYLTYGLSYTERYGVVCLVFYNSNNKKPHQTPVSMLSVLEANAIANEYLRKLSDVSNLSSDIYMIEHHRIKKELETLLQDQDLSEYTLFITLSKTHFPELSLDSLLKFVVALSRFTLDTSVSNLSSIANVLHDYFEAKLLGNWICVDLRRGGSRAIIFFKTVLLMHAQSSHSGEQHRNELVEKIKENPFRTIVEFWNDLEANIRPELSDIEYEINFEQLSTITEDIDQEIIKSGKLNRELVSSSPIGLIPFNDLNLIDPVTADDDVITMPNRINLDVLNYQDKHFDNFIELERIYNATPKERFHMSLDEAWRFRSTIMLR